jgi:hypothetical protein
MLDLLGLTAPIVISRLTPHQEDTVATVTERVGNPDNVDCPQAADRDKPDKRTMLNPIQSSGVEWRIGVVFAELVWMKLRDAASPPQDILARDSLLCVETIPLPTKTNTNPKHK